LLPIPTLNLKETLAQTTQNQPSSPLSIMKKSPTIIVTGKTNKNHPSVARRQDRRTCPIRTISSPIRIISTDIGATCDFYRCPSEYETND
jgi:hypothetical protein